MYDNAYITPLIFISILNIHIYLNCILRCSQIFNYHAKLLLFSYNLQLYIKISSFVKNTFTIYLNRVPI